MNAPEALTHIVSTFSGTLAAIIALAGLIAKIKPVGRSVKLFFFRELYEANENQDKRLEKLELQQLKQIICDRRLPDGERLNAGEEYLRRGGNGEIQMIYEAVKEAAKRGRLAERERREQHEMEGRRQA
jgi:uncharacterized membrane protein